MKDQISDTSLTSLARDALAASARLEPSRGKFDHDPISVAAKLDAAHGGASALPDPDLINIAFGLDIAYLPHAGVVVASIIANAQGARFQFLILHDGMGEKDRTEFELCGPGHTFVWLEINEPAVLGMPGKRHISRAGYFRLMIDELAPATVDRILYLDADLVVKADIRELYHADLDAFAIGAVTDVGMDDRAFADRFGLPHEHLGYFNSGILLLDLDRIRRDGDFQKVIELLQDREEDMEYGDQCALNVVFWQRWQRLDILWNVQRRMLMPQEEKPCFATAAEMKTGRRPKIIHFTEHNKPWSIDGWHPLISTYYDYLRKTPYNDYVREIAKVTFLKELRRRIKTRLNWWRLQP